MSQAEPKGVDALLVKSDEYDRHLADLSTESDGGRTRDRKSVV